MTWLLNWAPPASKTGFISCLLYALEILEKTVLKALEAFMHRYFKWRNILPGPLASFQIGVATFFTFTSKLFFKCFLSAVLLGTNLEERGWVHVLPAAINEEVTSLLHQDYDPGRSVVER